MVMKVGIIGTGNIAPAYIKGCAMSPEDIQIVGCADLFPERSQAFANEHNLQAYTIDELLADDTLDIILNLTIPVAHAEVSHKIIEAGKHVYVEKPLALNRDDGKAVLNAAEAKGVRVGCAPDTFLGAGGQTCRQVIDRGDIGTPIAATAFMANHGHESWHPNPSFYYQAGGGPMFDMGPYYLTALVNLMGAMSSVSAMTQRSFDERIAQHESIKGTVLPVDVDTHVAGTVRFASGATATIIMTFEVWAHHLPRIEIYGTTGTLVVPDPNRFDGDVMLWNLQNKSWQQVEPVGNPDAQRGLGVASMARAIVNNESHHANGEIAYHVLDAMQAFDESSSSRRHIDLQTEPARPRSLV